MKEIDGNTATAHVRLALLFSVLTSSSVPLFGQSFDGFDDFVARYRASPAPARTPLTESFIDWQQEHGGFPIIENDRQTVVFVYFGESDQDQVRLVGDFHPSSFHDVYWDRTGDVMQPIADRAQRIAGR